MFNYQEPVFNITSLDTSLFEDSQSFAHNMIHTQFRCMIESSIGSFNVKNDQLKILNDKMMQAIAKNTMTIQRNTKEMLTYIDTRINYSNKMIKENQWLNDATSVNSSILNGMIYENIAYNIPDNIPQPAKFTTVEIALDELGKYRLTKDSVKELNQKISDGLDKLRGEIIEMKIPIHEHNFESVYMKKFKEETLYKESYMTSDSVKKLIDNITAYPKLRYSLVRSLYSIQGTIQDYIKYITKLFVLQYDFHDGEVDIHAGNRITQTLTLAEFGYHNAYRTAILSAIIYAINMYMNIFNYKLSMIEEKLSYERGLLIRLINHINGKDDIKYV